MDSALEGGVAAGRVWCMGGEGSGEGVWPVLTAVWLEGSTLAVGEEGIGGGGIWFAEARRELLLEWEEDPPRVLMSGIVLTTGVNWRAAVAMGVLSIRWWNDGTAEKESVGLCTVIEREKAVGVTGF